MTPFTGAIKVPVRWVNQAGELDRAGEMGSIPLNVCLTDRSLTS